MFYKNMLYYKNHQFFKTEVNTLKFVRFILTQIVVN